MRGLVRWFMLFSIVLPAAAARAWTPKEYALLTRQAAAGMIADPLTPDSMRKWLSDALGEPAEDQLQEFFVRGYVGPFGAGLKGLSYWAAEPDLVAATDAGRMRPIAPFDLPERSLHYLNLEQLNLRPERRHFVSSLAHKPAFADVPRQMLEARYREAGMLPFRAEQCQRQLVDAIVQGRLNDSGEAPRDDHAAKWAGYLAHYIADGWEPPHATEDFRFTWAFPGNEAAQAALLEALGARLCDSPTEQPLELRKEYWRAFIAAGKGELPLKAKDTWESSVEALRYSYDFLPLIGEAAKASFDPARRSIDLAQFYHYRSAAAGPTLLQARAALQAMAVLQIRQVWLRSWDEAQRLRDDPADPLRQWRP